MKNVKRREKLASVFFALATYILTAIVAGVFIIEKSVPFSTGSIALLLAIGALSVGWFIQPPE